MTLSPAEFSLNQITTKESHELIKAIPASFIDLILCDPPSLNQHIEEWVSAWLAQAARCVLEADGFCMASVGTYWNYHALLQLGEHLEPFWDDSILCRNGLSAGIHHGHRTMPASPSLLTFRKGQAMPYHAVMDVYKGAGADTSFHTWGQDASSVLSSLSCFSHLGDLIPDPFVGGTVPSVCLQLDRQCIGFEIDPCTAEIAHQRLAQVQKPLPGFPIEQCLLGLEVTP